MGTSVSIRIFTTILLTLAGLSLQAKLYRGAELRTIATYRYGRYETRMQSAPHSGVISSLFTYHELGSGGIEEWNEIDIEFLGRYTDRVQYNTITNWQIGHEHFVSLGFDPATEFHDYAFEWTPNYIAWFVDDVEVYRQEGTHIALMNRYQKLMMNIWPPDYADWAGSFNAADLPIYAFYDWVKYYAYVPGTGNTGTGNNFILLWQDDFDTWNTSRWQKASHTWDGNNCDFTPANAVFQGGYFILCLTTATSTGYHGPTLGTDPAPENLPESMYLSPAWPNPFNGGTSLRLQGLEPGEIQFDIIDIQGHIRRHQSIVGHGSSQMTLSWDGRDDAGDPLPSGSYFCRVQHPNGQLSRKVMLLK